MKSKRLDAEMRLDPNDDGYGVYVPVYLTQEEYLELERMAQGESVQKFARLIVLEGMDQRSGYV